MGKLIIKTVNWRRLRSKEAMFSQEFQWVCDVEVYIDPRPFCYDCGHPEEKHKNYSCESKNCYCTNTF